MRKMLMLIIVFVIAISWKSANDSEGRLPDNNLSESLMDNFEGVWVNENEENPGITKCNFRYADGRFYVEVWASCLPKDCDWGESMTNKTDRETEFLKFYWDQGFVERDQTFEMNDGKLIMTMESRYKDKSGRSNRLDIEIFVRP